jgi:toxin CcdB
MARYDVFARAGGGYLLDIQADLLGQFKTRAVVPLLPVDTAPPPTRKLHPVFDIDGHRLVMATQLIGTISTKELAEPRTNLLHHHDEIVAALDMLFQGF